MRPRSNQEDEAEAHSKRAVLVSHLAASLPRNGIFSLKDFAFLTCTLFPAIPFYASPSPANKRVLTCPASHRRSGDGARDSALRHSARQFRLRSSGGGEEEWRDKVLS